MAFDGLFLSALVSEFKDTILGGKISKIVQSEKDELQLTIKKERQQYLLHLSVNPSIPLVYLTDKNKTAPLTAPSFCMALRKHIGNGVIQNITQASTTLSEEGLERVLLLHISHRDELGDIGTKYLSVEIMGKYSNIILLKDDFTILDAIKRISSVQSSVREVLPGRKYLIPVQGGKPLRAPLPQLFRLKSDACKRAFLRRRSCLRSDIGQSFFFRLEKAFRCHS